MRRFVLLGVLALAALAGGIGLWWALAPAEAETLADPADTAQVSRGAAIYAEACASCHGADLEGQPDWRARDPNGVFPAPPHDETGHTWHHADAALFDYVKLGGAGALEKLGLTGFKSGMPAFDGVLSDQEIWDVLAFIKSEWPEEIRAEQARRDAVAQVGGDE